MQEVAQVQTACGVRAGGRIRDERSIGELFRELADESRSLVQQEVHLAKAEMSQKLDKVTSNATSIGIGGAVAFAGVITLCAAASAGTYVALRMAGLEYAIAAWLAPLMVGLIVAGVGYGLIRSGITNLKNERLVPKKTAASEKVS
jgi:hypothetical protein